jgi:hypothetical protein
VHYLVGTPKGRLTRLEKHLGIRHLWVPVVHVRGPVVEKQQGKPAGPTEAPIREPDVSDLDELCAGGFVRIIGHQHPLLRLFQLSGRLLY